MNRLSRALLTVIMITLGAITAATIILLGGEEQAVLVSLSVGGMGWTAGAVYTVWCERKEGESYDRRLEELARREPVPGLVYADSIKGSDAWELPRDKKRTGGESRWKEEL